jgi:hypothetical protein
MDKQTQQSGTKTDKFAPYALYTEVIITNEDDLKVTIRQSKLKA